MQRYKIIIKYDGTKYHGWQMQQGNPTIQSLIELALYPLNFNKRVKIVGAGRTDAGVHAFGQVAHFDLDTKLSNTQLVKAINARLPKEIRIIDISKVNNDFHARFSAKRRYYRYQCYLGDNLLFINQAWQIPQIDKSILVVLAEAILGEHDFLSFSKINKQLDNTVCNVYQSEWIESENMLTFSVCGNRFLHHMVRYLVGTAIAAAEGKIATEDFINLLQNPKKNVKIFKAPAQGLILMGIDYE